MGVSACGTIEGSGAVVSLRVAGQDEASSAPQRRIDALLDSHGRRIREARISLTDRCNFRCVYCLDPDVDFLPRSELLSEDEVVRLADALHFAGVTKIRLTGGEPTLRADLESIICRINALGVSDIAMTMNGSFRDPDAPARWAVAGLSRVTLSLDSLKAERFEAITRSKTGLDDVFRAISLCQDAGLSPVKVNAVIVRGFNDDEIEDLSVFARQAGVQMRFIEYMPLDAAHAWNKSKLVPAAEVLERVMAIHGLTPIEERPGETSENFRFTDGAPGGVGVIAPVTRPFCGECGRLRITPDGKIRPCLFSHVEWDIRDLLRAGGDREALLGRLAEATWRKQAGHGIATPDFRQPERTMSAIGG
jgi:cyclic pyranopterin phosphate synthase